MEQAVGQLARVGILVEPTTRVAVIVVDDADNRVLEAPLQASQQQSFPAIGTCSHSEKGSKSRSRHPPISCKVSPTLSDTIN